MVNNYKTSENLKSELTYIYALFVMGVHMCLLEHQGYTVGLAR